MSAPPIIVWAREPIPIDGAGVFLAGPFPRRGEVPSWWPAAIKDLAAPGTGPEPLTVFTPESCGGIRRSALRRSSRRRDRGPRRGLGQPDQYRRQGAP